MEINPNRYPMMNEYEVSLIEKLLDGRKELECLEWGSGNSTFWFPKHPSVAHWTSVEHDKDYFDYVNTIIYTIKTKVLYRPDAYEYVHCVNGNKYDFILIDGVTGSRELCLARAFVLAKPDALILLHDSGREEYQPFIDKYCHYKLCDGEIQTETGYYKHRGLTLFPSQ